tara:strand:+ start:123 stop:380 length:258 start_codon:yes stop_codon:yes gene_type:complete
MSQKGKRGKPTRKQVDEALKNLFQGLQLLGRKIEYLEQFAKSTDVALDLYVEFNKDKEKFHKYLEEFQKKYDEEQKKVAKKEETS